MNLLTKLLILSVFLLSAGLFSTNTVFAQSDSDQFNVGVTVTPEIFCNNNGICETGMGEDINNCPADCAAPGGGDYFTNYIKNIHSSPGFNSAEISWQTKNPAFCDFYWGQTTGYESEIISETAGKTNRFVNLIGLQDSTVYHFRIICRDSLNPKIDSQDQEFKTLSIINNVSNFTAVAGDGKIDLSWQNPADENFNGVILLRDESFFPSNINEGKLIYQGFGNSFEDIGLVNGTTYYYTIFTLGKNKSYSSGAMASATPYKQGAPPPPPPVIQPVCGEQNLTVDDFNFFSDGKVVEIKNGSIESKQGSSISIYTDCKKLSFAKTVFVDLGDGQRIFSYILKPAGEEKNCSVSFIAPEAPGAYTLKIYALDSKNKILWQTILTLNILKKIQTPQWWQFISSRCIYWLFLLIIILLIILFLMVKCRNALLRKKIRR